MKCYLFRIIKQQWVVFCFAENLRELFWNIDKFTDPYSCQVSEIKNNELPGLSMCMQLKISDDSMEIDETEFTEETFVMFNDDREWFIPEYDYNEIIKLKT